MEYFRKKRCARDIWGAFEYIIYLNMMRQVLAKWLIENKSKPQAPSLIVLPHHAYALHRTSKFVITGWHLTHKLRLLRYALPDTIRSLLRER